MKIKNKKIALYIPDLARSSGGAEIYGLLMAEVLDKENRITIITHEPVVQNFNIGTVYNKYGVKHFDIVYVKYLNISHLVGLQVLCQMKRITANYDIFINCSKGKMRGMKHLFSIHLIHFPDSRYQGLFAGFLNIHYRNSYNGFICNSAYTQKYLKEYWNIEGTIVYPPISMQCICKEELVQKEKIILAVDRLVEDKKILEMINAYKMILAKQSCEYKFVIIGNKDNKEESYYQKIIAEINGYPIEVYHDLSKEELVQWYKRAVIFWHAKGYNEEGDPEKAEHFGMTTAEAMANGCVPIVINKAGQKEIVNSGFDGYRWDTMQELVDFTILLMNDDELRHTLQKNAVNSSKKYLMDCFESNLNRVLEEMVLS